MEMHPTTRSLVTLIAAVTTLISGCAAAPVIGPAVWRIVIAIATEVAVELGADYLKELISPEKKPETGGPLLRITHTNSSGKLATIVYSVQDVEAISVSAIKGDIQLSGDGHDVSVTVAPKSSATIAVNQAGGTVGMTIQEPTAAPSPQPTKAPKLPKIHATWDMTAKGHTGRRLTFSCPPGGSAGPVWGTDLYTDDSSVCTAAVHAGRISMSRGGSATIVLKAGAQSYAGSTRRGVTTSGYGPWDGSFAFTGARKSLPLDATWETTAAQYRGKLGKRVVYACPPEGTVRQVWGTDLYTDDSSICTAAAHAGRISVRRGGTVAIEIHGGAGHFTGSTRREITTDGYGPWPSSFTFVSP